MTRELVVSSSGLKARRSLFIHEDDKALDPMIYNWEIYENHAYRLEVGTERVALLEAEYQEMKANEQS